MSRKIINTDNAPKAIGTYSQAVSIDKMVFVSGQIPLDPKSMEIISENIDEQIEQAFKNLKNIILEADSNLSDIVKLNVYLKNMEHFPKVNAHMEKIFSQPFPARAAVEVSRLPKDVLIVVDAILVTG